MKLKKIPIGISDFKDIVKGGNYYYIDKTLLIKEILDKGDKILLAPRPRRFGKTLNISMLKYFFDCCPGKVFPDEQGNYPTNKNDLPKNSYKTLFEGLNITQAGEEYTGKMGKYPVIFLSFRNTKTSDWNSCLQKIKREIQEEYYRHKYLLYSPKLEPVDKDFFNRILELKGDQNDYESSLEMLMVFLTRYYEERAIVLIDEYDAPIHAGYVKDFYDSSIGFMRNLLCGGLKDMDEYLEKSVLTGILRIAKESIFSGFNNPGVYTLTKPAFNDKFGFTETEVETMLNAYNLLDHYDDIRSWYNGYIFGGTVIYNPWSILNFINMGDNQFVPYWLNTSDNQLIDTLLSNGGKELKLELEQLLRGNAIEKTIDENIVMKEIESNDELLWSFLLMSGYLKYTDCRKGDADNLVYSLSIPNLEVKFIYRNIIKSYFKTKIEDRNLEKMLNALKEGDIDYFEELFKDLVATVFSFHDFGGQPERVYHAFVAGLLTWLYGTHEIKSNRESGFGRYDIMLIPKNPVQTGYVIEFKAVNKRKKETVESATQAALNQIEEKKYETELIERGIQSIKKLAIVFDGKEVYVKEG